ncbi:MAG: signal peptidase II [Candidatus Firestonebacteria bacterium]
MLIFLWTPVVILLDQIIKLFIQQKLELNESLAIIPNIFHITYIRNKGAAFGLLSNLPEAIRIPFFIITGIVFLIFIIYYFKRILEQNTSIKFSFSLITGGAIGNFIDRVRFGEVIDFIEVGLSEKYKWPVFNLADSAITIGVVLLILHLIKNKKHLTE